MKLGEVAHARAGDKGGTVNISIIPYKEEDYEKLNEILTEERVETFFRSVLGRDIYVKKYELPKIKALNFVIENAFSGVTYSLALDKHGKTLSYILLEMELEDEQRKF
ncbi:conserved hypothetical protein [Ferroglobus placidus DSM 10642]|uniref:AtuA-like ferredoxin-fold domain-containing protein n=1 Tax=Ferroglobus placidus (strain DSM 10642 / AEDII12DO) TaxID=589924 RepID=D3S2P9_FERPA|nr:hypothetical protein [Ferroglobus placidus]ADC64579.1 conserved hypothetical protein [Ferroglobus placidus DSM 10642]